MEDRIRKLPVPALEWAILILFGVFALHPLLNYLLVCLNGLPDYSWGFAYMSDPFWEPWDFYVFYFGIAISLLFFLKRYLSGIPLRLGTHPALLLFGLFALWMAVSAIGNGISGAALLGSDHRMEGLITYLSYLMYFLLAALLRSEKRRKGLLWLFCGSASLLGLLLILDVYAFGGALLTRSSGAVFYNSNHFGYYLLMGALVSAGAWTDARRWQEGIPALVCLAVGIEALLVNNTEGAQIGFLFGLLLFCLADALAHRRFRPRTLIPLLLSLVIYALTAVTDTGTSRQMAVTAKAAADQVSGALTGFADSSGSLGSGRLGIWRFTLERIREKPWFGWGSDALTEEFAARFNGNTRCHCEYMHYALCYGIPAAVFYMAGVFTVFLRGLKRRHSLTGAQLTGLCAAFGYMVSAAVGNSMYYTAPFAFILLGFGYARAAAESPNKTASE